MMQRLQVVAAFIERLHTTPREVVEAALRAHSIEWAVAMELGNTEAVKQAVAAGQGLAVVSAATITQEQALGRLAVFHVPELTIERTLSWVRVNGRPASRALRAFALLVDVPLLA